MIDTEAKAHAQSLRKKEGGSLSCNVKRVGGEQEKEKERFPRMHEHNGKGKSETSQKKKVLRNKTVPMKKGDKGKEQGEGV